MPSTTSAKRSWTRSRISTMPKSKSSKRCPRWSRAPPVTSCAKRSSHTSKRPRQVNRLERVFELLDEKPRGKHCAGMAGILEEGSDILEEDAEDVGDGCVLIAGAQKRRALRNHRVRHGDRVGRSARTDRSRRGSRRIAGRRESGRRKALGDRRVRHQRCRHCGRIRDEMDEEDEEESDRAPPELGAGRRDGAFGEWSRAIIDARRNRTRQRAAADRRIRTARGGGVGRPSVQ